MSRVTVTRHFDVPAERVFDAWLEPAVTRRFLFTTPEGRIVRCDIDGRTGGAFVITDLRDGEEIEHAGEYLEVERPRRLVFTFAVPKYSTEKTRVTLDIAARGHSACELTLTHENVAEEWTERTRQGWSGILDGLAKALQ